MSGKDLGGMSSFELWELLDKLYYEEAIATCKGDTQKVSVVQKNLKLVIAEFNKRELPLAS